MTSRIEAHIMEGVRVVKVMVRNMWTKVRMRGMIHEPHSCVYLGT